jgi:predicted signal transduction protein with EAL and GGDEF domain
MTASIGIALSPEHGSMAIDLEKKADVAMYRAKSLGRNGCECFAPDMLSSSAERISLESSLRHAVQNNEMELHYQPQFGSDNGLIGFEAMVRWNHPELGLLPPATGCWTKPAARTASGRWPATSR